MEDNVFKQFEEKVDLDDIVFPLSDDCYVNESSIKSEQLELDLGKPSLEFDFTTHSDTNFSIGETVSIKKEEEKEYQDTNLLFQESRRVRKHKK